MSDNVHVTFSANVNLKNEMAKLLETAQYVMIRAKLADQCSQTFWFDHSGFGTSDLYTC